MPEMTVSERAAVAARRVWVWDLPTRLFHWSIVLLVLGLYATAKLMGYAVHNHALLGYALLTLILFRLVWGFVGSTYARFGDFVRGPVTTARYAGTLARRHDGFSVGHNPLGGWMVVLLLLGLLVQAVLGLFATDDILFDGPLRSMVSRETSALFTSLHKQLFPVLLGLIAVHILAVIFHRLYKGEKLVPAMFTGYKELPSGVSATDARGGHPLRAAIVLAVCAGVVYWLVS